MTQHILASDLTSAVPESTALLSLSAIQRDAVACGALFCHCRMWFRGSRRQFLILSPANHSQRTTIFQPRSIASANAMTCGHWVFYLQPWKGWCRTTCVYDL